MALLTLTMRHHSGQSLAALWSGLSAAWHKVTSGRGWTDDQLLYGSPVRRQVLQGTHRGAMVTDARIPFVKAVEVTQGAAGWHVHVHAVLFLGRNQAGEALTLVDVDTLAAGMFGRWESSLVGSGFDRPLRVAQDCKLFGGESAADVLGDYFTKATGFVQVANVDAAQRLGWEAGLGQHKAARGKNRTPFQILADVMTHGLVDDLDLWHEWEQASKGKRQVTWSTGLRALLALEVEATDAELVERSELDGDVLAILTAPEWSVVRWHRDRVLQLAEVDDNGNRLRAWLAEHLYPEILDAA